MYLHDLDNKFHAATGLRIQIGGGFNLMKSLCPILKYLIPNSQFSPFHLKINLTILRKLKNSGRILLVFQVAEKGCCSNFPILCFSQIQPTKKM